MTLSFRREAVTRPPAGVRAEHGVAPDEFLVVMIGNIKEWKGQETLVRAMAPLTRECRSVRCLLVGATAPGDRPYEERLRQLAGPLVSDGRLS